MQKIQALKENTKLKSKRPLSIHMVAVDCSDHYGDKYSKPGLFSRKQSISSFIYIPDQTVHMKVNKAFFAISFLPHFR